MSTFSHTGILWKYSSDKASWFFVTLDKALADQIKGAKQSASTGWGQIKVEVTVGETTWKTSLFPAKKGEMILAIKKDVRQKEGIEEGDEVTAHIVPVRF